MSEEDLDLHKCPPGTCWATCSGDTRLGLSGQPESARWSKPPPPIPETSAAHLFDWKGGPRIPQLRRGLELALGLLQRGSCLSSVLVLPQLMIILGYRRTGEGKTHPPSSLTTGCT